MSNRDLEIIMAIMSDMINDENFNFEQRLDNIESLIHIIQEKAEQ